jgi:hypothetical protein
MVKVTGGRRFRLAARLPDDSLSAGERAGKKAAGSSARDRNATALLLGNAFAL